HYVGNDAIEQPVMGVYRIDTDHSVHLVAANVWKPNGVAVSPDQKTLYVISIGDYNLNIASTPAPVRSTSSSAVHAYDLLPDGSVRYRKQLVDFPATRWGDGMKVDTDGNLYVGVTSTVPEQNGVYVFSPEGQQVAMLPTP